VVGRSRKRDNALANGRWPPYSGFGDGDSGASHAPQVSGTSPADSAPLVFTIPDRSYQAEGTIDLLDGAEGGLLQFYNHKAFVGIGVTGEVVKTFEYSEDMPLMRPSFFARPAPPIAGIKHLTADSWIAVARSPSRSLEVTFEYLPRRGAARSLLGGSRGGAWSRNPLLLLLLLVMSRAQKAREISCLAPHRESSSGHHHTTESAEKLPFPKGPDTSLGDAQVTRNG